jgi:hypothetical protein
MGKRGVMQGKIRPVKEAFDEQKWHRWFAWYPCRALINPELVWEANKANKTDLIPPYRWVWLTYVERRYVFSLAGWEFSGFIHRVTEETK